MLVLVGFCFDKGGKRLEIYPFHKDNNAHVHFSLVYRGKNIQYTNTEKKTRVGNVDFNNNNKKKCFYNLMKKRENGSLEYSFTICFFSKG